MFRYAVAILLISFFLPSYADIKTGTLMSASYEGRHTGMNIKMIRELKHQGDGHYVLTANAKALIGYINESSEFTVKDQRLIADHYQFNRSILGKKSDQSLRFDWQNKQAHYRRSDKKERNKDYELVENTLDPSLYQLKLQQELAAGQTTINLFYAKDSRIKNLQFATAGDTTYTLNKKTYHAIKLQRVNHDDDKQTHIVVIPELNFQIALITHTEEDGDSHTVKLTDYHADNQAVQEFYQSIQAVQ